MREIPLSKSVVGEFLEFYGARSENAKIFDFSPQMARRVLGETCEKLGLPRYRLHEFRHTFVSNLIRAGVPLPVVANVSGDLQTTLLKRYSHMFPNDEKLILEALSRGFGVSRVHVMSEYSIVALQLQPKPMSLKPESVKKPLNISTHQIPTALTDRGMVSQRTHLAIITNW